MSDIIESDGDIGQPEEEPGDFLETIETRIPQTRMAMLKMDQLVDRKSLERGLHALADNGWNSVVIPALVEGYPIFHSQAWKEAGMRPIHPRIRKWDPFELVFEIAWKRGLEVLIYQSPYGAHGSQGKPPVLQKHPDWATRRHPKKKRRPFDYDPHEMYFCPVNHDYRRFFCDMMHALLEEYPFHGLVLDLRRHPFYSIIDSNLVPWCFCDACRAATLRDLGFDPADLDFDSEKGMVERWREWQAQQIDKALAHIRTRSLKARSTMRVLGYLSSDSEGTNKPHKPLVHWKTWVEHSLVEALVLDGYPVGDESFQTQLQRDVEMLPDYFLLLPILPRRIKYEKDFLQSLDPMPIPGFVVQFEKWSQADFDPAARIEFDEPAFAVESDPIRSVCVLFQNMSGLVPHEEEFRAFLCDLVRILLRDDVRMSLERLMMVADNIKGLYNQVLEGQMYFAEFQDQILHDLDLAYRLVFLAVCDLKE